MTTNLTSKTINGNHLTAAENDTFSWRSTSDDFLTHKPTGKQVYQSMWYEWKNSQPITDQTILAEIKDFWATLAQAQKDEAAKWVSAPSNPTKHGDGWCNKHESYCYGDCQS
jgi:hypothetical protein